MKEHFVKYVMTFALSLMFTLPTFAAETYTLDPQHTYVLWHINHLGFSTQVGKWYATGTLVLDKENPKNSQVNATIQIADIVTGIPELDKHLKGKLFFNAEQFPVATFVSDQVDITGKSTAKVHGKLTIHGVTKPAILMVKLNQVGINPISDKMTAGFSATAKIKRSDFGISTLLPSLGDEVQIDIGSEAFIDKK